ncbi:putative flavoprotein [Candidatus Nitrososphaera evergladensis SR1]|uniref:Putative flavoprotein n=1 Tax=Candidatus Nitrososphaera evergladensis SR1 TaxID=1459636 RepID=A0A075MP16_9ARCH|nr:flavodoxin domain-containing protein [Candidatus Nitrososphaera evergladensis]AIF82958.1 putative flavoprotein [Candidatus Nitrososphaera evergladensis SR1]
MKTASVTRKTRRRCERGTKAIILFDTLFGNTEKVGNSLVKGLREAGIEADCANITDTSIAKIANYDFIAIGAPTQFVTASKPIKQFLERLRALDLKGKYGFAFDTRLDDVMAGSAAEYIEKKLVTYGLEILRPHSSATVVWEEKKIEGEEKSRTQANIKPEMKQFFETIGRELGELLHAKEKKKSMQK